MLRQRHPGPVTEPDDPDALVRSLLAGELFVYESTPETRALTYRVQEVLQQVLGQACLPKPGEPCPAIEHAQLARVRAELYGQDGLHRLAAKTLSALGMPEHTLVDTPRLRVVTAGAEQILEARPVFVAHRDTWYGCPQGQINWWIPVFDCPETQSFAFYPEYFDKPVPNASTGFDYDRWMKQVGWHGTTKLEDYPAPTETVPNTEEVRLPTKAGQLLLFAAAHLHQTRPNQVAGSSRLSLDFRAVVPGGPEAPNADNHSVGAEQRLQEQFQSIGTLLG